jgi:hypothetical protein
MYTVWIIILVMVPILATTYKQKRRFFLWLFILLPPFFIVPFALIPIRDPLVLTIWLPILLFLLGSVISLFARVVAILLKPHDKLIKIKLIRPALTILIFVCVFAYHKISKNMADIYGIKLAQEIQTICDSNGLCPESVANWKEQEGFWGEPNCFSTTIHRLIIPYGIYYHPSEDRKSFTVYVSHGFNMGTSVEGGIDKKLKATYSDEGGEYEIPIK